MGDQPDPELWTCSPEAPRTLGWLGPHISTSNIPIWKRKKFFKKATERKMLSYKRFESQKINKKL